MCRQNEQLLAAARLHRGCIHKVERERAKVCLPDIATTKRFPETIPFYAKRPRDQSMKTFCTCDIRLTCPRARTFHQRSHAFYFTLHLHLHTEIALIFKMLRPLLRSYLPNSRIICSCDGQVPQVNVDTVRQSSTRTYKKIYLLRCVHLTWSSMKASLPKPWFTRPARLPFLFRRCSVA